MTPDPNDRPGPSLAGALGLVAVSAALTSWAFPLFGAQRVAWVALAPLLLALASARPRRALLLGTLYTFGFWYLVWDWGPGAVSRYFEQPLWVGFAFLFGTSGLLFLPYLLVFAVAVRPLAQRYAAAFPALVAAGWAAQEMVRTRVFTGGNVFIGTPWGVLAYTQVGVDSLVQIAAVTGVYGVSFALVAVNAAIALLVLDAWQGRLERTRSLGIAVGGVLPAALVLGYGAWVLEAARDEATGEPTRVAVVQGNLDVGGRWRSDLYGRNLDVYLGLTRDVLAERGADLVLWPEAAMTFFLEREPGYRFAIGQVLTAGDAELVSGSPYSEEIDGRTSHYNSVYLLRSDGEIETRYDKQYLLPFAEFFPLGHLDLLNRDFGAIREFTPGAPGPPLPTRAGRAGVLVCNEAGYPAFARERVEQGAEILLNPSNDGWVADREYAEQIFELSLLRAVEQRRYLVRASTSGPSAIIDPYGRILARSRPFERATLVADVHARNDRTLYSRAGDTFAFLCLGAVGVALLRRAPSR